MLVLFLVPFNLCVIVCVAMAELEFGGGENDLSETEQEVLTDQVLPLNVKRTTVHHLRQILKCSNCLLL